MTRSKPTFDVPPSLQPYTSHLLTIPKQPRPSKKHKTEDLEKPTLITLPPEIFNLICDKLSLRTLLKLSEVNRELYYNRLNKEYFVQRISERGIRRVVYADSLQQCEICGQEEDERTNGSNRSPKNRQSTKGVHIEKHPLARNRLCGICMETKEYRMINGRDIRDKYHVPYEVWSNLRFVDLMPDCRLRNRPRAYWEAEVKA